MTEKKFIQNQIDPKCGKKLYKTGDYGQYLPNGNIVFMGRKDKQVKIRGYRIEPQEIEWHLLSFPSIKEAAVVAKKNIHTDKHLEAFIVVNEAVSDTYIDEIYAFLQERLPPHMWPSLFNILEKMPLTDSGKIDRISLETNNQHVMRSINKVEGARTDTEKKLIDIMEGIFKINIGINNSFISIGGNSLLAMHVVTEIRNKFEIEIPAHSILSDPTIAHSAKIIDFLINI